MKVKENIIKSLTIFTYIYLLLILIDINFMLPDYY